MEELDRIIENYLKAKDSDYAIMINGDWGCGKSFYIKHDFQTTVASVECPKRDEKGLISAWNKTSGLAREVWHKIKSKGYEDEEIKYEEEKYYPFYISLYGIASVADFNACIQDELFGMLGKGTNLLNSFLEGKYNVSLPMSAGKLIPHNAVLVFDDLERICLDKISPIEVLGLINTFSEQRHLKVIIICNEKAFCQKTPQGTIELHLDDEYKRYKEKTVRFTYTCKADIPKVYGELIKEYKEDYTAYLIDDEELILSLFSKGGKDNIRTLKFFMDIYERIYQIAQSTVSLDYAEPILRQLVITTLIYVMEYKVGVTEAELNSLHQQFSLDTSAWLQQYVPETKNETKKEESDKYSVDEVRVKYSPYYDEMTQMPWLIEYISTGALKSDDVIRHIQKQEAELKRMKQSPAASALQKLKFLTMIEDEEVKPTLGAVLEYVDNGEYKFYELLDAYSTLAKYVINGIEDIKLYKKTDKLFKDALIKSAQQHVYDSSFDIHALQWDRSAMGYEEVKRYYKLREFASELNAEAHMREYQSTIADFYKAIEADGRDVEEIASYRLDEKKRFSLQGIDWDRVLKAIMNLSNPRAIALTDCIGSLLANDYSTWKENEYKALQSFDEKIAALIESEKRVRKMYMIEMSSTIKSFLQNRAKM